MMNPMIESVPVIHFYSPSASKELLSINLLEMKPEKSKSQSLAQWNQVFLRALKLGPRRLSRERQPMG